jgi:hypothetical protein
LFKESNSILNTIRIVRQWYGALRIKGVMRHIF